MKSCWAVASLVATTWVAADASACGTCSVGDPTLTIVGMEQPKANRARTSAMVRVRNDSIGDSNVDELTLSEQRMEFGGAYSPTDRFSLSLMMPVVHRLITEVNLAEASIWAPGDLDFRMKGVIWRDRKFAPKHLVSLIGGLEFPTSTIEYGPEGRPLPLEFQAGTGSWDPIVGASYGLFMDPWSLFVSSIAIFPTTGIGDTQASNSFRQTVLGQYQPWTFLAFQLGVEFRIDGPGYIEGVRDPNTGGHITYGTLGIVAMPHEKALIQVTAALPMIQRLDGTHREGFAFIAGVVYEI
ncbi:MAG: hypothetical protein JSV06_00130 [Myxococcales bacterium]|nr:MAG: hypothetical protein JSV06_00130 [Myxococcales bacterium]